MCGVGGEMRREKGRSKGKYTNFLVNKGKGESDIFDKDKDVMKGWKILFA